MLIGDTAFLKLTGTKSSYSHLKAFRCLWFMCTFKEHQDKFTPRVFPCVFIGHPFGKKAYKLYNLDTNMVVIVGLSCLCS